MASPLTDPGANLVLDALLGGDLFACLFTADPGLTGGFSNEVTTSGYARVPIQFAAAASRAKASGAPVEWPPLNAPVTATHWGVATALTGGTLRAKGALAASTPLAQDDFPNAGTGQLSVSVPT